MSGRSPRGHALWAGLALPVMLWLAALPEAAAKTLEAWRQEVVAVRRLADNDVAAALQRSRALIAEAPPAAGDADRAAAMNALARAAVHAGDTSTAQEVLEQARALARSGGDKVAEAEAALTEALVSVNLAHIDRLVESTTQAVALLDGAARPDLLGEALLRLGSMYSRFGQQDDLVTTALQAMDIAQRSGDEMALTHAHNGLAIAFDLSGRVDETLEHYRQMRRHAAAAGSRMLEGYAMLGEAGQINKLGQREAALVLAGQALAQFRAIGAPFAASFALFALAELHRSHGDVAAAVRLLDEVEAIYRGRPNLIGLWYTLSTRSSAYESLGRKEAARADAEAALATARTIGFPLYLSESARRLSAIAALDGDYRRAYQLAGEAGEMSARAARERASLRILELVKRYRGEASARQTAELTRRGEQQAAELASRALQQRWLWTLVAAITVTLAVTLVFVQRLRRKGEEVRSLAAGLEQRVAERTEQLARAQQAAEAATRAKSEFLANMSHEIRTPMNAILGMSWLALQGELSAQQRSYVDKVHRAAESLLGVVNDILDFSRIEAGRLDMEHIPFRLGDVMEQAAGLIGVRAAEKGLELLFDIAPEVPQDLVGDPTRLGQVLLNLGNNAVKFTEQGELRVAVTLLARADDTVMLRFEVSDTGIGIDARQRERLFQPFTQADASTSRRFGGSGLGLAICRHLVDLMGGTIGVDSEPGAGSRFHFTARFGMPPQDSPLRRPEGLAGMRMLVVDDHAGARELLCALAGRFGCVAEPAAGGVAALQALARAEAAGLPPALVLIDWRMPGVDGLEVLAQLASTPRRPRVVMMASPFDRQDLERELQARQLVVDAVLPKPVTAEPFAEACAAALGLVFAGGRDGPLRRDELQRLADRLAGAKVLLVEDNVVNQELAQGLLRRMGVDVTVADDGHRALQLIDGGARFDAVLMDCQMPVLDGYEATRQLRRRPGTADLPVIAMTASAMAGDRERALAAGMNDHVTKPVRAEHFYATLARWVGPAAASVDQRAGIAGVMGDEALYRRLTGLFVERERQFEERFRADWAAGDAAACARHAHDLRSEAATLGAQALQQAAGRLEALCHARAAEPQVMQALQAVLLALQPALQQMVDSLAQAGQAAAACAPEAAGRPGA